MPDLAFDLRYLKYAMLAAEHGSFRRAADALAISQSTVSRRVQLLERRIGIALFERTRSGVKLTVAGERFMREASVGASHLREAVNSIATARRGDFGELRIGLMASLASGFLANLLASYHQRFPSVELKLREATSQTNAAGVLNGWLDVAFIPGEPKLPGCKSRKLWDERVYVALPETHVLATRKTIAWDDIRDETFLISADVTGPEIEDYLVRHLSGSGFRPRVSVQHVGRENLLNMVARGFGITLTTHSTLGAKYSDVLFQPIIASEDMISSSAVWSVRNINPALKKMLDLIRHRTA